MNQQSLDTSNKKKIILKSTPHLPDKTKKYFCYLIGFNFFLTIISIELAKYYFTIFNAMDSFRLHKFPQNYDVIENSYFYPNVFFPILVGYCIDYLGPRRVLTFLCILVVFGNFFYIISTFTNCTLCKSFIWEYAILGTLILAIGGESLVIAFFCLIIKYYPVEQVSLGINISLAIGLCFGRTCISLVLSIFFVFLYNGIEIKLIYCCISITVVSIISFFSSLLIFKLDYKYREKLKISEIYDLANRSEPKLDSFKNNTVESLSFSKRVGLRSEIASKINLEYNDEISDVYSYTFWQSFKKVLNFRQVLISIYSALVIANFNYFLVCYIPLAQYDNLFIIIDINKDKKDIADLQIKFFNIYIIVFSVLAGVFCFAGILTYFLRRFIANSGNRTFIMIMSSFMCGFSYFCFSQLYYSSTADDPIKKIIYVMGMLSLSIGLGFAYSSMFSCLPLLCEKNNTGISFGFISCLNAIFSLIFIKTRVSDIVNNLLNPNVQSPILFSNYFKFSAYYCLVGLFILIVLEIYDQEYGMVLSRKKKIEGGDI